MALPPHSNLKKNPVNWSSLTGLSTYVVSDLCQKFFGVSQLSSYLPYTFFFLQCMVFFPSGARTVVRYGHIKSKDDQLWRTSISVVNSCLEFLSARGKRARG